MDNIFTSGPLLEELAQDKIYIADTIKQRAVGLPESLKGLKLFKGNYACEIVGGTCYYVSDDYSTICFVSNVFPDAMEMLSRVSP